MDAFENLENVKRIFDAVCAEWPPHEKTARRSLVERSGEVLSTTESLASQIVKLCGGRQEGLETLARDYRFTCEKILLPEELYFRRSNSYRLSCFEDADREVYSDPALMGPYLNGLLLSYVMWSNHAHAIDHYLRRFLPGTPAGARHLEIGPGHGFLLFYACLSPSIDSVNGWDVSSESVESARRALGKLKAPKHVDLQQRNILQLGPEDTADRYDNIVLSEILEHLEDPVAALVAARAALKPGGRVWISIPANSPAPDHLFLVNSPEHACELVSKAGLSVIESHAFPTAGATVEKALQRKLSISCVITAAKS